MGYVIYADNGWDVLESQPTNFWTSNSNTLTGIDCNSTDELMVYTNGSWVTPYSLYLPKPPTDLLNELRDNTGGGLLFVDNGTIQYIEHSDSVNSNNLYVFHVNNFAPYLSFPVYMFKWNKGGLSLNPPHLYARFLAATNTPIFCTCQLFFRLNVDGSRNQNNGTGQPYTPTAPYRMRVDIYNSYSATSNLIERKYAYIYRCGAESGNGLNYIDTTTITFIYPYSEDSSTSQSLSNFTVYMYPDGYSHGVGTQIGQADDYSYIRAGFMAISLYTMPY